MVGWGAVTICVQAVTAKGRPNFDVIEKQERKKKLSGYKQCYMYINQYLIIRIWLSLRAINSIIKGKPSPHFKSCLQPW